MIQERKILAIEYAVIILLWCFAVVAPLIFMDDFNENWRAVHIMWTEIGVIGVVYLINRFVLMPRLFFVNKYSKYIIALSTLFVLLGVFIFCFDGVNLILSLFDKELLHDIDMLDQPRRRPPHAKPPQISPSIIPPAINVLISAAVVVALDIGLSIASRWIISEQKQADIKRERVATQLSNLQSQVSPHFFMNTLNNIHALVDIDPQRAKQTIIELSELMDYLLYETSNSEQVALQRELDFIDSYINLMRLRYPKRVDIKFSCKGDTSQIKIAPLLFLNFIENSFKYGVDYSKKSFIKINFDVTESEIMMSTTNSNHSQSIKHNDHNRHGLGIHNSEKRLKLLFGDEFSLDIMDNEDIYYVTLKIPVK